MVPGGGGPSTACWAPLWATPEPTEHVTPLLKSLQWLPSALLKWVSLRACPGRPGGRVLPIRSSQLFPGPLDPQCPHEMQPPRAAKGQPARSRFHGASSRIKCQVTHCHAAPSCLQRKVLAPRLPAARGAGSAVAGGFRQSHARWVQGGDRGGPRPRPLAPADWQRGPSRFLQTTECQCCGLMSPEPPAAASRPLLCAFPRSHGALLLQSLLWLPSAL